MTNNFSAHLYRLQAIHFKTRNLDMFIHAWEAIFQMAFWPNYKVPHPVTAWDDDSEEELSQGSIPQEAK